MGTAFKFMAMALVGVVWTGAAFVSAGEGLAAVGRAVAEKTGGAVVWVRVNSRINQGRIGMAMGNAEDPGQRQEALGTIVDPSGLTAVCMSLVDPETAMSSIADPGFTDATGKPMKMEVHTEILSAALILPDGSEVPADVIMEDKDLDVAFLRPKEPGRKFDAVTLKPRGAAPQLGESMFVVGRMGRLANRTVALEFGAVRAVVPGQRSFAVCTPGVSGYSGCPAFAADGTLMGLFLGKFSAEHDPPSLKILFSGMSMQDVVLTVVRPPEDILEALGRAKQATGPVKPPVKRETAPTPPMPPTVAPVAPPPPPPPPPPDTDAGKKKGATDW